MYSYRQKYGKSIEIESSNKIEIMMHTHGWQMARTFWMWVDHIPIHKYIGTEIHNMCLRVKQFYNNTNDSISF